MGPPGGNAPGRLPRGVALLVARVGIGPRVHQHLDYVNPSGERRKVEGRVPAERPTVQGQPRVRLLVEQRLDNGRVPFPRRVHQRGQARLHAVVGAYAVLHQVLYDAAVARKARGD